MKRIRNFEIIKSCSLNRKVGTKKVSIIFMKWLYEVSGIPELKDFEIDEMQQYKCLKYMKEFSIWKFIKSQTS